MATNSEGIKTISIASLLALLMFSVVWTFATGAVVQIPPHSLRTDLVEMGRPIQAVAVDIDPSVRRPRAAAAPAGPQAPRALVAVARPVAAVVERLTQSLPTVLSPSEPADGATAKKQRKAEAAKLQKAAAVEVLGEGKSKGHVKKDRAVPGPHPPKSSIKPNKS